MVKFGTGGFQSFNQHIGRSFDQGMLAGDVQQADPLAAQELEGQIKYLFIHVYLQELVLAFFNDFSGDLAHVDLSFHSRIY